MIICEDMQRVHKIAQTFWDHDCLATETYADCLDRARAYIEAEEAELNAFIVRWRSAGQPVVDFNLRDEELTDAN